MPRRVGHKAWAAGTDSTDLREMGLRAHLAANLNARVVLGVGVILQADASCAVREGRGAQEQQETSPGSKCHIYLSSTFGCVGRFPKISTHSDHRVCVLGPRRPAPLTHITCVGRTHMNMIRSRPSQEEEGQKVIKLHIGGCLVVPVCGLLRGNE